MGLEPIRPKEHKILSLACLPIPPLEHYVLCDVYNIKSGKRNSNLTFVRSYPTSRQLLGERFSLFPTKDRFLSGCKYICIILYSQINLWNFSSFFLYSNHSVLKGLIINLLNNNFFSFNCLFSKEFNKINPFI